jgi:hypothetical protein
MSKGKLATQQEIEEIKTLHAWVFSNLGREPMSENIKALDKKWAPIDVVRVLLDHIDALALAANGSNENG